jgi:hypothetical protein
MPVYINTGPALIGRLQLLERTLIAEFSPDCESAVLLSYLGMIEIPAGRQPGFYDFRFSWKVGEHNYNGKLWDEAGLKYLEDDYAEREFLLVAGHAAKLIRKVQQLLPSLLQLLRVEVTVQSFGGSEPYPLYWNASLPGKKLLQLEVEPKLFVRPIRWRNQSSLAGPFDRGPISSGFCRLRSLKNFFTSSQ